MQKIHIIMRCVERDVWRSGKINPSDVKIVYCGYLEFDDTVDVSQIEIWHWCNWSCWNYTDSGDSVCPPECKHLLIDHCNSDMSYLYNGEWYSHDEHKFSSSEECFKAMLHLKQSEYDFMFDSLWGRPKNTIEVSLETIDQYIK